MPINLSAKDNLVDEGEWNDRLDEEPVQVVEPVHDHPVLEPDQHAPLTIPHHQQATDYTCGPASMMMVLDALWGIRIEEDSLARRLETTASIGTRQKVLARFVDELGLEALVRHTDTKIDEIRQLMADGHVVIVCYWLASEDTDHYAVVQRIGPATLVLQDPWAGPDTVISVPEFDAHWRGDPAVPTRHDRWLLAIKVPERPG